MGRPTGTSDAASGPLDLEAPHALAGEAVLGALGARRSGLSAEEALQRLAEHGPNELPHAEPPGLLRVVLRQFASPLIYILMVAGVVALALGDAADAGFILVVLVLNAAIGAVQEHRAERSADALRALVSARAHVLRDGEEREIDAAGVVPGDIVVLESGAKVLADLRLLSGSLEIDESLLTGESVPVLKRPDVELAPETPLAERATMAFAGTIATRGRAYGVVVRTGMGTQLGRIASSISEAVSAKPPLVLRMERFTRKIAITVAVAVVVLGATAALRGADLHDVFMLSIALAVSVIPEGLPVAMTVALAIAVRRMSRRKVIARRLAAVEALGSCTFIASDKTGTLTRNELTVQRVLLPGRDPWVVEGDGRASGGRVVVPPGVEADGAKSGLERLGTAVALCNDATLRAVAGGASTAHGDAVDVALLVLADGLGLSRGALELQHARLAEVPFEAERQYAAVINAFPGGPRLSLKGAGERVLAMCSRMAGPGGEVALERAALEFAADELAAAGFRMLAVADGAGRVTPEGEVDPACLGDLVFLGFTGMIDPLRPEAADAIRACRAAGVEVAMVTGDHPVTALAIAQELDLVPRVGGSAEVPVSLRPEAALHEHGIATAAPRERVVTGAALASAKAEGTEAYDALVSGGRVFARVEPQQKLDIVQSLIRSGHFVAVTGDGANDAPAMRAAHIGVAMGERGTDVARETGELILTDDNFASIVAGIEEGRVAYGNVRKVIFLLVSCGAAELVLFTLSTAFGLPLPLFAAQLLWLNLVTNGIQDVALAFEPAEGDELARPPRKPREPIFDGLMLRRTLLSAVVIGGVSFAVFAHLLGLGWEEHEARNALLLLLVLFENVQAGNSRSERHSLFRMSPLRNPLLFLGALLAHLLHIGAMYTPGLRDVLRVEPVSFSLWLVLLAVATSLFVVLELDKLIAHLRGRRRAA